MIYFSNFLLFHSSLNPFHSYSFQLFTLLSVPNVPPLSASLFFPFFPPCPGSSVSGHDESPGDHAATDAADPPAAGSLPPAAPGPAPAAAGCNAAAGTDTLTLQCVHP